MIVSDDPFAPTARRHPCRGQLIPPRLTTSRNVSPASPDRKPMRCRTYRPAFDMLESRLPLANVGDPTAPVDCPDTVEVVTVDPPTPPADPVPCDGGHPPAEPLPPFPVGPAGPG